MKINLNLGEQVQKLEVEQNELSSLQNRIATLMEKKNSYEKALDNFYYKERTDIFFPYFLDAIPTVLAFLASMMFLPIISPLVTLFVGTITILPTALFRKKIIRENINSTLSKLGKGPLDSKTKITRKLKKNIIEQVKKEQEDLNEEVEALNLISGALGFKYKLHETELTNSIQAIPVLDKKETPLSNLNIRTRNALLFQQAPSLVDDSKVEAVQFVKKR